MSFSSGSETLLSFVEEVDWGVTPNNPEFQRIRATGEGLSSGLESETSSEFNPIPDTTDLIITGASADGDINFELSYGEDFHTLLSHALRGDWNSWGQLVGAAEQKSMTIEKMFTTPADINTEKYFRYPGARVNSLSINIVESAKFEGTIEIMARNEQTIATAAIAGSTYINPNSNPVMAAPQIRNVTVGVSGSYVFKDTSFTVDNGVRSQTGFSTGFAGPFPDLEAKGIAYGRREITGSLTAYFSDEGLYNTFKNNLYTWLMFDLSDGERSYRVFFPRVKFSDGQTNASDNNSDVESALEWTAILNREFNSAIIVEAIGNITDSAIDVIRVSGADAGFGRYFQTDEVINAKPVYLSFDESYALWYNGAAWFLTSVSDKDTQTETDSYTTASDIEAGAVSETSWAGQGAFAGSDVKSQLFDPTAAITTTDDFKIIANV